MNFSDYMDTCCTEFKVKLKYGELPLLVDILDADIFESLISDQVSLDQYTSLCRLAERLIFYHYNDVK